MNNYLKYSILAVLLLLVLPVIAKDRYVRNPYIDVIHYTFSITLNDSTDRIEGKAEISLFLFENQDSVSFDLVKKAVDGNGMIVTNVTILGKQVKWYQAEEKLVLFPDNYITGDTLGISVEYFGVPADGLIISRNKFGKRVFFSDHWPDRAHNYLPCIDHPYDKAAVEFYITAPSHYKVVSNGVFSGAWIVSDGLKCTHWEESVPLPVKVMAFGVADFAVNDTAKADGIPVSSWVFPENAKEGFFDYSVAVRPLEYYITHIGTYPYKKLANVQSKTIYGGLENAGAIFYAEKSVTGMGRAEELISHEIAHQWFGNNITENDWYHIWLSEGFATYLTSMYFEVTRGEDFFRTDMDSTRAKVLRYYRKNRMPVIDTTVTDLMKLLNPNSYQKGAWALHMLRDQIGDSVFRKGLQMFYNKYRNSNVVTDDFRKVMEEASGQQLNDFFRQWLYTGGQPVLDIRVEKGKRGTSRITIEQKQDRIFTFPVEILIGTSAGDKLLRIQVKERLTKYTVPDRVFSYKVDPDVKLLFDYSK
ncbi:MAG TPA: M1 family metallopeptidase [Bacteroidales bacterium]|nr:M1 family metallopeptidase [Bacteroidales bacterium]